MARATKQAASIATTKGESSLEIVHLPIDSLHEDPDNARAHNERNLSAIRSSLAHFGQQKPIVVDEKGCVVAGNGTLVAAKALGWKTIAAVRTTLVDENSKRAFALADNRTAELAEWNYEALSAALVMLGEGADRDAIGFTLEEIETFSGATIKDKPGSSNDEPDTSSQLRAMQFKIIIENLDEATQLDLVAELEERGFACKALII